MTLYIFINSRGSNTKKKSQFLVISSNHMFSKSFKTIIILQNLFWIKRRLNYFFLILRLCLKYKKKFIMHYKN